MPLATIILFLKFVLSEKYQIIKFIYFQSLPLQAIIFSSNSNKNSLLFYLTIIKLKVVEGRRWQLNNHIGCFAGIPMWLVLNTIFILKSIALLVFICIFKLKKRVKTSSSFGLMMMGLIIFEDK